MQEKTDGIIGAAFPQHRRQQHKMIVMDPNHVPRLHQFGDDPAKLSIDSLVYFPHFFFVYRQGRKIMKQRPHRLITEPQIELVHYLRR